MDVTANPGMSQSIYVLTSKLAAQQRQFALISDNVANVNTAGFKRLTYDFETVSGRNNGINVGDFVKSIGVLVDHTEGVKNVTSNPFDLAITGPGFFAVDTAQGVKYTRDGSFTLNSQGQLVTPRNETVQSDTGGPIQIPLNATNLSIAADGSISNDGAVIANIGVFNFEQDELQQLSRAGNGFFAPDTLNATTLTTGFSVQSGQLEQSNINAVEQIVQLQELSNSFQAAIRRIGAIEDLEERAIRTIAVAPQ